MPTSTDSSVPPKRTQRWPAVVVIIVGICVLAVAGMATYAYSAQGSTIVRSVTIGGVDVGSLTTLDALTEVERAWDEFAQSAFVFTLDEKTYNIPIENAAADGEEVILDLASFNAERSVNAAFDFGHRGPWWQQVWERTSGWIGRRHEFGQFSLSTDALNAWLEKQVAEFTKPAVNAGLSIADDDTITLIPSQAGQRVDVAAAVQQTRRQLTEFNPSQITLHINPVEPEVVSNPSLEQIAANQVPDILDAAPLTMTFEDRTWQIDRPQLAVLLGFQNTGRTIRVTFDHNKTVAWLDVIRPEIDVEPRNAKFSVAGGRVEEFQTSVVGRSLNAEATVADLQAALTEKQSTISLTVKETLPLTDTVSTNDLGIRELVAEGRTNFRGSPPNRVYNLSYGAEKLHGLLIKPGETFSLVKALGSIDAANGWKPELVIKGSRITPEYGGGLCQVATTLFRATLNTGLPIVERQNHSLRISYYEPPIGLDATIYEPKPDLKFRNDYATALLLQTRVEGTELIFSFYGTKDGRTVDIPEPKVFNRVPIPATQRIEVDDLAPGEEECQAPGHPGADAIATYTVTKSDGQSVTQEFTSHYRAIPVICRVGKKAD